MATYIESSGTFSGRNNFDIIFQMSRLEVSGNASRYTWALYARQLSGSDSFELNPMPWGVSINGQNFSGSTPLDFRGATNTILLGNGNTNFFGHDSNGNADIAYAAQMINAGLFGTAATNGVMRADRIPKPPATPPQPNYVNRTTTSLSFTLPYPSEDGGAVVNNYLMQLSANSSFTAIVAERANPASAQTFDGLTPNTQYWLRYAAFNSAGNSAFGPALPATTAIALTAPAVPPAPTYVNRTTTSLSFTLPYPSSDGGTPVTNYLIQLSANSAFTAIVAERYSLASAQTFNGLASNTPYWLRYAAFNAVGNSAFGPAMPATTAITLATPTRPPTLGLQNITPTSITFSMSPPGSDGNSPILDYYTEVSTNSSFSTLVAARISNGSAQTFAGLTPGINYFARHRARNSVGNSLFSVTASVWTPATTPQAPTGLNASSLAPTSFTLNWSAPNYNGGAPITKYSVHRATNPEFTQNEMWFEQGASLSKAFTDLLPSTTYYFQVVAGNSAGWGFPGSVTIAITTTSGVYYSTGTTWISCGVFVSNGATWIPATLFVSNGTTYIAAI